MPLPSNIDAAAVATIAQALAVALPQDAESMIHELRRRYPGFEWRQLLAVAYAVDSVNRLKVVPRIADWRQQDAQIDSGVAANANKAGVAGVRHVCTSAYFQVAADTGALAAAFQSTVDIKDGGTILWRGVLLCPAAQGSFDRIVLTFPAGLVGTAGNAMQAVFANATNAFGSEIAHMDGYDLGVND